MAQITPPGSLRLPNAPEEYERRYQDQVSNTLRLYTAQLDNALRQLLLGFNNYATFYDTQTRTNPVANAENLVPFNTVAEGFGITLAGSPPTRITVSKGGVYNFQFSSQLDHSTGGAVSFFFWFKINGTTIPNTGTKVVVNGPNSESVAAWNYLVTLKAGDYFELAWSATDTTAVILAAAASSPVPAIPSTIMTVVYVCPNDIQL